MLRPSDRGCSSSMPSRPPPLTSSILAALKFFLNYNTIKRDVMVANAISRRAS